MAISRSAQGSSGIREPTRFGWLTDHVLLLCQLTVRTAAWFVWCTNHMILIMSAHCPDSSVVCLVYQSHDFNYVSSLSGQQRGLFGLQIT